MKSSTTLKTEPDPDAEVYSTSCSEIQHNTDRIKTEPDPDAEVYWTSCSEIQLVDVKQEEQPVSISFPSAKDGNDVSCQCVSVVNGVQQWRPAGDLFGTCL